MCSSGEFEAALRAFERWAARHEIEESPGFLISRPVSAEVVREMLRALATPSPAAPRSAA